MKSVKDLIEEYLAATRMMQVATCVGDKPWCCTVFYAHDKDWNLYWISKPETRHSQEIMGNPHVAGAITYAQDPFGRAGVRGLQFEGTAKLLMGVEEERASAVYIQQMQRETSLLDDVRSGKNPHKFYGIRPAKFVLFDTTNFPDKERQEYVLG